MAPQAQPHQPGPVLEVRGLKTHFKLDDGLLRAVDGVTFSVARGQTLAVIGESGCGKSVMARSILRLVKKPGFIAGGEILLHLGDSTVDVAQLRPNSVGLRDVRGQHVSMVFQEPMTSLSPVHTVGDQIAEVVRVHRTRDRRAALEVARDTLAKVGMPDPARALRAYPHELSGGLRQRAMIAMALAARPALLIADEPTTALDVTVQWQILRLLQGLQAELGMAMLYITHDLGVVAQIADAVAVMYLGRVVEYGSVYDVFENPLHPYTRGLMKSMPALGHRGEHLEAIRGNVPVPINLPRECPFRSRCDFAFEPCGELPALLEVEQGHATRCFLHHREVEHA
ncbi:ABC transporter ATP-binding protein (plasmid) [Deinococcus aetherius]|uniref:ABC transporter ATP-binding protein n=1 Tax=Deinococcus aetherius TaxID=200252 RepID=A0ABM8AIR4_9DEIO|nr:ABC transporter ATP-binding protein [Deinococcus aetherius]BDP43704.1 ABC transporter ATP-binding protein [Deinococcus aetherius]